MFSFEGIDKMVRSKYNTDCSISYQALWYSWLARRPVTAEVVGSSPIRVVRAASKAALTMKNWGLSSAGRAPALQAGGHRFEPCRPQLFSRVFSLRCEELADVAQLAEQLICNQQVIGSSPIIGSIWMGSRAAKGGRL